MTCAEAKHLIIRALLAEQGVIDKFFGTYHPTEKGGEE